MTTNHFLVAGVLLASLTLQSGNAQTPWTIESAQAQVSRTSLLGTWRLLSEEKSANVESYTFRSNGTYSFQAGREKSKSGNVAHSGTWRILRGGRTLVLNTRRRTVLSAGRRITIPASRTFKLPLEAMGDSVSIDGYAFSPV